MNELIIPEITNMLKNNPIAIINAIKESEQKIYELKQKEQEITSQRKFEESTLEKFKEDVRGVLEAGGYEKIETNVGTLSLRLNPISVEITNIEIVPDEFKTIKTTIVADKKKIAEHFKSTGEIPDGCVINTEKTSLQVK